MYIFKDVRNIWCDAREIINKLFADNQNIKTIRVFNRKFIFMYSKVYSRIYIFAKNFAGTLNEFNHWRVQVLRKIVQGRTFEWLSR